MNTITKQVEEMGRNAKHAGFSRNKASRHAPVVPSLHKKFMAAYDRARFITDGATDDEK